MGDNRSGNFGSGINHSWSRPEYEKTPSELKSESGIKKAEFPHESFKAAMQITPVYTQSEMDTAIAARDKWWVTQMETNFMGAIGCRLFPGNCDSCSIIERCTALGWQRFKNMLEVK